MSKIEKRVVVNCSIERLFTYVPEAAQSSEIWPGLLEVGEVQRLPLGGVMARWIYKMTGVPFEELDERCEPLVDRDGSLTRLGNVECVMKWNFQLNTHTSSLTLDGDHTYWSMC
ncbi:MAG: hypothetical protein HGB05_15250 [Chloroflexi bacterium]|nr:hypothetical protein [Chloroflexota bacterium]